MQEPVIEQSPVECSLAQSIPRLAHEPVVGLTLQHCLAFLTGGHERCGSRSLLSLLPNQLFQYILSVFDGIWYVNTDRDKENFVHEAYEDDYDYLSAVVLIIRNGIAKWQLAAYNVDPCVFPLIDDRGDFWPLSIESSHPSSMTYNYRYMDWIRSDGSVSESGWFIEESHHLGVEEDMSIRILTLSIPLESIKAKLAVDEVLPKHPKDGRRPPKSSGRIFFQLSVDPAPDVNRTVAPMNSSASPGIGHFGADHGEKLIRDYFDIKYIRCIIHWGTVRGRVKIERRFFDLPPDAFSPTIPNITIGAPSYIHLQTHQTGFEILSADPLSVIMLNASRFIPRYATQFYLSALAKYADV